MAEPVFDEHIDLSGEVCPYTFVKSKLALEDLEDRQVLSVLVDNGESAANVPRSMELEGHEVLSVDREPSGWRILVRKSEAA